MLTIHRDFEHSSSRTFYEPCTHFSQSPFIKIGNLVVTSCMPNDVVRIALRCNAPLDAYELEARGYQYCFFERDNIVSEDAFITLTKLGLNTVVYFCDAYGTNFDDERFKLFANTFNVSLCKVHLPFSPCDFSTWDDCQWRIFETRLSLALNKKRSQLHPIKLLCGGINNAPIH